MIQRIQTLYMLIVTALMAVTLFAPLAWFAGEAGEFGLYAFSLKTAAGEAVQPTVYMGVVLALACVLPLVTIFLFRRSAWLKWCCSSAPPLWKACTTFSATGCLRNRRSIRRC